MAKRQRITTSDFYCTCCGKKGIPIARKIGAQREAGHLKKLYCIYCKKETNHCEIRPFGQYTYADFQEEFEMGRFVNGKRFEVSELPSCKRSKCKYNKNGKCWNSNNSTKCKVKAVGPDVMNLKPVFKTCGVCDMYRVTLPSPISSTPFCADCMKKVYKNEYKQDKTYEAYINAAIELIEERENEIAELESDLLNE